MSQFNEGLSTFLVECREGALEELKSDTRYADLKTKQADLYTKLEQSLSNEALTIMEEYKEVWGAILSMEYNKTLITGLTIPTSIKRLFDSASAEHAMFASEFISP